MPYTSQWALFWSHLCCPFERRASFSLPACFGTRLDLADCSHGLSASRGNALALLGLTVGRHMRIHKRNAVHVPIGIQFLCARMLLAGGFPVGLWPAGRLPRFDLLFKKE